jgi:DNA polymerase III epsilon subunit family exonuclease
MGLLLIITIFGLFFWFLFAKDEKPTRDLPSKTTLDLNIDWDKIDDEFVIFDLETTGLKSNKVAVDIVEIGALKVKKEDLRNGIDATAFQALLIPHRGGINPEAARINGITESMIKKDGESAEKVMNEFVEFVGNRKLIAYNVDFDRWFLKRELEHWGIKKTFKYECAYELSKDAFSSLTNYKLATVAKSLGIQNPQAHRSLGDCITTLWVYLAAKSKL